MSIFEPHMKALQPTSAFSGGEHSLINYFSPRSDVFKAVAEVECQTVSSNEPYSGATSEVGSKPWSKLGQNRRPGDTYN